MHIDTNDERRIDAAFEEVEDKLTQLYATRSANRVNTLRREAERAVEAAFREPDRLLVLAQRRPGHGWTYYIAYITQPPDKEWKHPSKGFIVSYDRQKDDLNDVLAQLDDGGTFRTYNWFRNDTDFKMICEVTDPLDFLQDNEIDCSEPENNQGRQRCWWCDRRTNKVPGFYLDSYDLCPNCKK